MNNNAINVVAMAICPLALAATDASRGMLLAMLMTLCLALTWSSLNMLRSWVPGSLLLPLLLLLCCGYAFLLRIAALLCCYGLANDLYHVLPLAAASTAVIMLLRDGGHGSCNGDNDKLGNMAIYASLAFSLLLSIGIIRGLLAYGELYVPVGKLVADGPLPIFAEAPGAFLVLALLLAAWQFAKAGKQGAVAADHPDAA